MKKYTKGFTVSWPAERKVFFIFCFTMLISAGNVFAQAGFTGPAVGEQGFFGQQAYAASGWNATVIQARNMPHDTWVVLSGNIINMLPGGRQYTFRDTTGDIAVDIGPKEWRGLSVDMNDRVEIYGEVKLSRGQIHIKVHAISGTGRVNTRAWQTVTVTSPISINEARSLPYDSWVVLNGNIINILTTGKHSYLFRDFSGSEIIIDIGPKVWRGLSVGVSDNVEIYGEIKINRMGQIHIKVHAIKTTGV
ncbi:MAG: NirD/YgiW/YdeI family stress tolerance protein [Treponema sp.]|nr:NirD/YgiW/YdeI family stress tolerance protein [Treponema sp.]MCL2250974.1 NirD/YgiW/YdeI family stress tolerance protein [Treponema sp.]